jgi:hypothetical protein
VKIWVVVTILVLAELVVFARIPAALWSGAVPLNPLGWFGYSEMMEASVERRSAPGIYWLILLLMTMLAMIFGYFIYVVATSIG